MAPTGCRLYPRKPGVSQFVDDKANDLKVVQIGPPLFWTQERQISNRLRFPSILSFAFEISR